MATKSKQPVAVRPKQPDDLRWVAERTRALWGDETVVTRGRIHRPVGLPGIVAWEEGERIGLATYHKEGKTCELVTLDAVRKGRGVGTALVASVVGVARAAGCTRLWLVTTNDNIDALRFCQRRGFRLVALHRDAIRQSRLLKRAIPATGDYGIPLRDEIELERQL